MNKLLVLVACVLGTVSAGRILLRDIGQREIGAVDQRIERMSRQDLQRQKFILDIVQRVQQPLQQDDLIQLDQGLIIDSERYRGGIDGEMQRVIDLDRQRRLLNDQQVYSIRNVEHVQQLRGIYRLLVRAIDFETLQRNVIYLRRNINPVLLINALTLAIRDREDTQALIVPAVQEILPELYLDQQLIEQVQRMQSELEQSPRPSLMDLVGLGQRMRQVNPLMRMIMPWRDLHLQMALRRQQFQQQQTPNRVVLPVQATQGDQDISLLTDDIGMRNFIQSLIQELALYEDSTNSRQIYRMENEMDVEQRRRGYGDYNEEGVLLENRRRMPNEEYRYRNENDSDEVQSRFRVPGNRVPLMRNMGEGIGRDYENQLPTGDIRSGRLLHVGRRRQNLNRAVPEYEQTRFVRSGRLSEGRRVGQEQTTKYGIFDEKVRNGDNMQYSTDNLQSVPRDDERLVHINRRRLGQTSDNVTPRRYFPNGEGRSIGGLDTIKDEDILQYIRKDNRLAKLSDDEIIEMVRRNRQGKAQGQDERFSGFVRGERLSDGRRVDEQKQEQGSLRDYNQDKDVYYQTGRRMNQPMENTSQRLNPFGDIRRVETMKDEDILQYIRNDNRLAQLSDDEIIDIVRRNRQGKVQGKDKRFNGFVREDRLDQRQQGQDYNQYEGMYRSTGDDERLGSMNRRRFNQPMEYFTPRRVSPIGEGRRVGGVDTIKDEDILQFIRNDNRLAQLSDDEIIEMLGRNRLLKDQSQQERFLSIVRGDRDYKQDEGMYRDTDNLQGVRRDEDRFGYMNRRRFNQPIENFTPRRVSPIGEGRRVGGLKEEDIMQLIRSDNRLGELSDEEIIEMLRRNRQRKEQQQQENEENSGVEQGNRFRRSLVSPLEEQQSRRSEMLLQTLRQLLARLNQERIAMRLGNDDVQPMDNSRFISPYQDQAQRYALRLNEQRLESRRNRVLIEQINSIESRLQQVIGQLIREMGNGQRRVGYGLDQINDEELRFERAIGNVLMGRLGDIGILRIVRDLLQDVNVQMDRLGLGISLNDRMLQYTLRRIISLVDEQREQQLGGYRREQLDMPEVTINEVRVSKLRTRIEDSDMDVSNLLERPEQMQMMVRQRRLNNKPFTIDMDISSQRSQDVIIRVFLGPRQDVSGRDLSLEQRRSDFILLDAVNAQLESGRNRIQLRSTNIGWTSRDATPYSEIYRRVMSSLRGQQVQTLITELVGENGRFPQRLLLPRGRPEGLPMQLFVIVSPVERLEREQNVGLERIDGVMGISVASLLDRRPLGFPLDRRIENEQKLLQLSNIQVEDVVIVDEN